MSNVYLRNRKPSSYEKYIAIKYIDTELTEMYKSKNEKYFPKGHKRIYIEMHNNNLKAIQIGAVIYNERSRHSGDIDSIAKCINLVNELIHYSEENLQLLQYHMKNLNLDDRDIPATKKKIAM